MLLYFIENLCSGHRKNGLSFSMPIEIPDICELHSLLLKYPVNSQQLKRMGFVKGSALKS
jgi:hypothetical protein